MQSGYSKTVLQKQFWEPQQRWCPQYSYQPVLLREEDGEDTEVPGQVLIHPSLGYKEGIAQGTLHCLPIFFL